MKNTSSARKQGENSWPKIVFKKLLHINNDESDYSADEGDNDSDYDDEEDWKSELRDKERRGNENQADSNDKIYFNRSESFPAKLRRRNSETLRTQYINTKELRVCVGTWNAGGKLPGDDLDIEEWLDVQEPADIYVLGLQEIIPLNAGNIFGAVNNRPVLQWESLIRDALNRIQQEKPKYKSYSDPPSPARFRPPDDAHEPTVDELLPETDTDSDDEVHPLDKETSQVLPGNNDDYNTQKPLDDDYNNDDYNTQNPPKGKGLERCRHFAPIIDESSAETSISNRQKNLARTLSSSQRIGLVWPEQSLELLAKCAVDGSNSNALRSTKSLRAYNSFKQVREVTRDISGIRMIPQFNWDAVVYKRRSQFVRIVGKQMVGIFLSIWVRRSLRKYIQNLKVSTVGVGIMGCIGNKGSVSVSMSIYQTPFCFVCTHLTSGEKSGDELRRNAAVQEIHRRTRFRTSSVSGLPQTILDHERIFWFGDLNYRINLSYERTHELISEKKWSELFEGDQLKRELKKGRAFDGWSEGVIKFPPTYKYEFNSEKYIRDDLKGGRRTPAWCDRILAFGMGVKLLNYRRSELKLSDHRPVTATYMAEVEVFSHRKLQKALTLTDAEIEDGEILSLY